MATIDIYQPAIFHKNINVVKACKTSSHINCGHNCGHSGTIWSSSPFDTLFRCVVVIIVVKKYRQYDPLIPPRYYETAYEEYKNTSRKTIMFLKGVFTSIKQNNNAKVRKLASLFNTLLIFNQS